MRGLLSEENSELKLERTNLILLCVEEESVQKFWGKRRRIKPKVVHLRFIRLKLESKIENRLFIKMEFRVSCKSN